MVLMNELVPKDHPYREAIMEVRAINGLLEHKVFVRCPDCKAVLQVTSAAELPSDLRIEFVKHCS